MRRYLLPVFMVFSFSIVDAQSKTLEQYISIAIQNSPLIKDYQDQIEINRFDSLIQRKAYAPQISANSDSYVAPVIHDWGYDEIATNIGQFTAQMRIEQEISGKSVRTNLYDYYQLQNQSIATSSKLSEIDLHQLVTDQYLSAYAQLKQFEFDTTLLSMLNEQDQIFKQLTTQSVYKQTEYLMFHSNILQQQLSVTASSIAYKNELALLNEICGISDTSFTHLLSPNIQLINYQSFTSSQTYQQFKIDSLLVLNLDQKIDLAYHPKFSVFGDAGYYSTFQLDAQKNFGFSVGFSLSIPIYDGGIKKLEHDKTRFQLNSIENYKSNAALQYDLKISRLNQQLNDYHNMRSQIETQLNYLTAIIEADKKMLTTGDMSISDYLITINNYTSASYQLIQNTVITNSLIAELNYLNLSK